MLDEVRICSWHSRGQMLVGICQIIVRNEGRYCKGRRRRGSDGAGRGLRNGGDCDLPSAGRGEGGRGVQGGSKEGGGGPRTSNISHDLIGRLLAEHFTQIR